MYNKLYIDIKIQLFDLSDIYIDMSMECIVCSDSIDNTNEKIYTLACGCKYDVCNQCITQMRNKNCLYCRLPTIVMNSDLIDNGIVNANVKDDLNINNINIPDDLYTYVRNYNILRILAGMGGLAYTERD